MSRAVNKLTNEHKQSVYFPSAMLAEIRAEATRLDRPLSWVIQHAWKLALKQVRKFPSQERVK